MKTKGPNQQDSLGFMEEDEPVNGTVSALISNRIYSSVILWVLDDFVACDVQVEPSDATCMSKGCKVSGLLLAHHHPRLLQYLHLSDGISSAGRVAGRVPR